MEQIFSNPMLLTFILDGLTSQELLQCRLVCKLWKDRTNRLIRMRQKKFYFSPNTKTCWSPENRSDPDLLKSWENVLQVSFIYSPRRDTFIRVTRRFINAAHPFFDLESSLQNSYHLQRESAYFKEIENFYNKSQPWTDQDFIPTCKTAGKTIHQFMEFLQNKGQNGDDFDDLSIFPDIGYRFECGRLRNRLEIYRFFQVLGPKIKYLTVGLNHMCKRSENMLRGSWDTDEKWDHEYKVFRMVPNLQVLTIVPYSRWICKLSEFHELFRQNLNKSPRILKGGPKKSSEGGSFLHLQCLRITGDGGPRNNYYEHYYARLILLQAKNVQRIVHEGGLTPNILSRLDEVNLNLDVPKDLNLLPRSVHQLIPITKLSLKIFEDSPQTLKYMTEIIHLQQIGGGQGVKTLYLHLETYPNKEINPYSTLYATLLLKILKVSANSLETLSLVGGSAVLLEGLLQNNVVNDHQKSILQSFPNVRKLIICPLGVRGCKRQDFYWSPNLDLNIDLDIDPQPKLTSNTALSKVFPKVEELHLEANREVFEENKDRFLWMAFLPNLVEPSSDLFLNNPKVPERGQGQAQGQSWVDQVTSVKKIYFGRGFPERVFDLWKFSNLQALCLDYAPFSRLCSVIWSLTSLESLTINKIPTHGYDIGGTWPPMHDSICQGLSKEVIAEYYDDLQRTLDPPVSELDSDQFPRKKMETLRVDSKTSCILDLVHLRHLKLFYYFGETNASDMGSDARLLLHVLLPTTCHLTIWALRPGHAIWQPLPYEILEKAVGPSISSHPRWSLRTVRFDQERTL